ncbi:hypothetical protein Plhal304r1_c022g0076451 [Plasmopara halstedii]
MQFSYAIFACILAVTFIIVTDGKEFRKGLRLQKPDKTKTISFEPRTSPKKSLQ